ncbi:MAG: aspartate 1-decarboxylase, partial [Verrucomicrobiales bacterium]|nr:aspartate 1-decarboxylase [Verrucomicrobiales bacterium]
ETYTLKGERGTGIICVNGAAARLINEGELIIVIGFELTDGPLKAKTAFVDSDINIEEIVES